MKLKVALVSLRAAYTLGLLLIILDATIIRPEPNRNRLLITTSDSPLMRLPRAGDGKTRSDEAEALSRSLSNDERLAAAFVINRTNGPDQAKAALADAAQDGGPVSTVIYFTDGSDAAIQEAESLSKSVRAPLGIVHLSRDAQTPDVSIISIDCGGAASLDAPQTIMATLAGRAVAGRSTLVKLSDEGIVVAQSSVNWGESAGTVTVPILLVPKIAGLHRYVARAEPSEGELNTEDNEAGFSLDVRPGGRRILFIESQPTWEGKFIRRALEEDASIAVDYFAQVSRAAVLSRQQSDIAGGLHSILGDLKKLARYDTVIAGPLESSALSEREAQNITEFVERRGGGLVILGGNDFNGSILSASSRLARLSPAIVAFTARSESENASNPQSPDAPPPAEKTVAGKTILAPTREGESLFFNPRNNLSIDPQGPLSPIYLRMKALKPGAIAMAVDGAGPSAEKPVLIAAQRYGYGRTLLVAPADSWRIQLAEAGENKGEFAALWQNIASWAASNAEPATNIRLRTSALERGDALRAYLTVRDDSFNPVTNLTVRAEVEFESEGGKVTHLPVTVERDPASPGVYELNAVAGDEGTGSLSVELEAKEIHTRSVRIEFSVQAKKSEWRESFDAGERLAQVAQTTGGELWAADRLDLLKSKLLGSQPENRTSRAARHLRNSVALAFLLPLLMAWEYFLRRRSTGDQNELE